jgi:hypothetical protein
LNYIISLGNHREISGVISCGLCASLPVVDRFINGITLITSPYLLNYDIIFLLVLLIVAYDQEHSTFSRLVLIEAHILSWLILVTGRKGNYLLLVSTLS